MRAFRRLGGLGLVLTTLTSGCGSSGEGSGGAGGADAGSSPGDSGIDGSVDSSSHPGADASTEAAGDVSSPTDSASPSSGDGPADSSSTSTDSGSTGEDARPGPPDAGGGTPVDGGPPFSGPTVAGTVTVNRGASTGQVGPGFAGFSFEKTHMTNGSFTGKNAALIALLKLVAPTVLRIGADDVDKCMWVPATQPGGGGPPYSRSIGTVEVDDLGDLLAATGARVIYGVNFNSATTANSAAEATYVTTKLGASVYGFEIGNEINRFGKWATTLQPKWESFANAILSSAPAAHLIGPAGGGGDALSLTTPFAQDEASKNLILLTQHYYAGTAGTDTATVARLLTVDPDPPTSQAGLLGTLNTTNAAAVANKIPDGYRVGECNTFAGHGENGVSNALISALWGLDFMFTSAEHGASGVNFHGGEPGMDGNTPFYYSPIEETNGVVTNANPLFYGMVMFTLAGSGKVLTTTASAGGLDFTAYTVALADGSTSVVLDNKDTTSGVRATVNVGAPVGSANAIYLLGPTPASLTAMTGITLAGAGITPAGDWNRKPPYALTTSGNSVSVLVPPASAALVRVQ
jgi:hypothetical protein